MNIKAMTAWIVLSGLSVAAPTLLTRSAFAQTAFPQGLPGSQQQDPTNLDFLSDSERGSGTDLLSLMNQIRLASGQSAADFAAEQSSNLDAAAAEFRVQQLQRIQSQRQTNSPGQVELTPVQ